jgi:Cdc6-like AAA superfamily ATPase
MLSESVLARQEDRLKVIQDRVRGVADHDYTGFYLHGPPGTSKTYTVRTHLDRLGTPHQYRSGHLTPLGLFELLAEHPDEVIVLDDVGHIFEQKVTLQILLAALGSQPSDVGKRVVRYRRQADVRTIHFSGGVIFISNLSLHKAALLQALKSRVHCLHYDPTDEELAGLMLSISEKGWAVNGHYLNPAECKVVAEFVINESQQLGVRLDLRALDKGFRDYAQWAEDRAETNWKDLVRFTIEQRLSELQHTQLSPAHAPTERRASSKSSATS